MPNELLSQVKDKTSQLRNQVKQKREQLIGGSPGQTEIAGNAMEEIQSRMSERFDVMQERRPRLLADILKVDELPIDVTEQGGGILGKLTNSSGSNKVDVSGKSKTSKQPKVDVSQVEFSGGEHKGQSTSKSGVQFSG